MKRTMMFIWPLCAVNHKWYGSHVISWHLLGDSVQYHKEFVTQKWKKNLFVSRTLSSTMLRMFLTSLYLVSARTQSVRMFLSLCSVKRPHCCKRNVFHSLVDPNFSTFTVPKSCHYWKGGDPCHLYGIMVICQVSSGDFEFPLSCEDQKAADGSCKSELQL